MTEESSRLIITFFLAFFLIIGTILSVRLYQLLDDCKRTLGKLNKILDDASIISESIAKPVASISALVSGFKEGSSLVKKLLGK